MVNGRTTMPMTAIVTVRASIPTEYDPQEEVTVTAGNDGKAYRHDLEEIGEWCAKGVRPIAVGGEV
jgi:hypothetical protein